MYPRKRASERLNESPGSARGRLLLDELEFARVHHRLHVAQVRRRLVSGEASGLRPCADSDPKSHDETGDEHNDDDDGDEDGGGGGGDD